MSAIETSVIVEDIQREPQVSEPQVSEPQNDLSTELVNKADNLSIQSTSVIPSELIESNLGEVNPNYPNLFHNYYDMEYINTGATASTTIGQPRWNRLPIVKVSNKVLFSSQDDVINYIVDKASSNIRAIYWTDLFRNPSDIPYHIGGSQFGGANFNYQYQITNNQLTGGMTSEVSNPKLDDYTNRELVRNAVLPLFTTNNMLHLSISWTDITIRLVPTTNSFVIVESHNNLDEYGHSTRSCYP